MPCDLDEHDRAGCILSWHDCSDEPAPDALTVEIASANREAVRLALRAIPHPRLERVIRLRFGLYDGPALSLRAVGEELGVGPERVRQMQNKALRIMRFRLSRLERLGEPPPDRSAKAPPTPPVASPSELRKKRKDAGRRRARASKRYVPAPCPQPKRWFRELLIGTAFHLAVFATSILLGWAAIAALLLIANGQ
ncbi:hypothetical protein KRZ98_17655 [Sphingobium sp. AS12]|uniref:sigma factor-like helix-turn-helix DNA-binding protein n=1 Tax=Sphingobium sp. AS12 TaxID=2849495 RepID=UPI001C31CFB4|nr:sigma factor-like helix-turn-helix DNA-binding protein [Sphingobium sp. AS12]MBV2150072.1 hypothetical protein [Sphingobium sp. AS12]